MRLHSVPLGLAMSIILATTAQAQQTRSNYAHAQAPAAKKIPTDPQSQGAVHRIETYSGTRRSVRYLPAGNVSSSDRAGARELQHAENEASYLYDLERLKQQYVSDERVMEQDRLAVQRQLYGTNITSESDASQTNRGVYNNNYSSFYPGYPGYGWYGRSPVYPSYGIYGAYPYLGYGAYGGIGAQSNFARTTMGQNHTERTVTRSLRNGVGDEGRVKEAMAHVIAGQSSPEYGEKVMQEYEKAMSQAASSPTLAKALSVRKDSVAAAKYEPSFSVKSEVTIWTGADKVDGVVKADRPGWVVLETDEGEVSVRKSTIGRSLVHSNSAHSPKRSTASK